MAAKVLKLSGQQEDVQLIREAADVLNAGGLVAFPTETVYGIACRAQRTALSLLDRVKGRSTRKVTTAPAPAALAHPRTGTRLTTNATPTAGNTTKPKGLMRQAVVRRKPANPARPHPAATTAAAAKGA